MKRLAVHVEKGLDQNHEVLRQAPAFVERLTAVLELRLQRIGILRVPLANLGFGRRAWLIVSAYARHWLFRIRPHPKLLTQTYLQDPSMK
jgi:hypothetical protein